MTSADYDDFSEVPSCRPDKDMGSLDQLQAYQFALRYICPLLDPYESAILMQIIDRTAGWKKHAAYFSAERLLWGDNLYGGISRQMHRSKLMKALASLEQRRVISRLDQEYHQQKIYRVNYDVDLDLLTASAPKPRKRKPVSNRDKPVSNRDWPVSNGDQPVHETDQNVSSGDVGVSQGDPREGYTQNSIIENKNKTRQRLAPPDPIAARSPDQLSDFDTGARQPMVNPRPRRRKTSIDNER